MVDRQTIKITRVKGVHRYAAGKHITGRMRRISVNNLGLLLVVVHVADVHDRDGAKLVLEKGQVAFFSLAPYQIKVDRCLH